MPAVDKLVAKIVFCGSYEKHADASFSARAVRQSAAVIDSRSFTVVVVIPNLVTGTSLWYRGSSERIGASGQRHVPSVEELIRNHRSQRSVDDLPGKLQRATRKLPRQVI